VGLTVLEVIEREHLADHARQTGEFLKKKLAALAAKYPRVISQVRGLGLMIGIELAGEIPAFSSTDKAPAIQFINQLHEAGLLAIPAGARIVRVLPALNLPREEAAEGLRIIESVAAKLSP
jgi:4-aminobutyrate aminotransferase-like enzyme